VVPSERKGQNMEYPRTPGRVRRIAAGAAGEGALRMLGAVALLLGVSLALRAGSIGLKHLPLASRTAIDQRSDTAAPAIPLFDDDGGAPGQLDTGDGATTTADPPVAGAPAPPAAGGELSRAQAIALVEGRYRGARIVRTTLQDEKGRPLYVFRLLSSNGMVWTVRIDAHTGAEVP
jgi:hypothetical protein